MSALEEKRPLLEDSSVLINQVRPSRLWRNAAVLNVSAIFMLSGVTAIFSIESSLNAEQGLGVTYMAISAVVTLFASLLAGVVIRRLGGKRTIALSQLTFGLSLISHFFPSWGTFIPAAILGGTSSGFVQVAMRVYTAQLGHMVSDSSSTKKFDVNDVTVSRNASRSQTQGRFFLFFVACYKLGYMFGNLGSSVILSSGSGLNSSVLLYRSSSNRPDTIWFNESQPMLPPTHHCGAGYCNENLNSDFYDLPKQNLTRIYAMISFCMGMCLVASMLTALFLDDLDKMVIGDIRPSSDSTSLVSLWMAFKTTLTMHTNPRLLLFVPFAVSLMAMDSFWTADFSKAFVTCPLGMEYIGYVMLWIGVSATLASVTFGWMSSRLLRRGPLMLAHLMHVGLAVGLLFWTPDENSFVALCAYTAAWCTSAGIRHSIFPALVSMVFRDRLEQAFSNILMWGSAGTVMIFVWSNFLCMHVKLYLVIAMLITSVLGYIAVEVLLDVDRRRMKPNI